MHVQRVCTRPSPPPILESLGTRPKGKWLTDEHIHLAWVCWEPSSPVQSNLLPEHDCFHKALQIHLLQATIEWHLALLDRKLLLWQQIWWQTPPFHQSPACLHSDGEFADRELVKVQKIQGICDCGVCIIAFALHVALGDDPQNVFFEQCHHLLGCFQKLEPFPRKVTSIP